MVWSREGEAERPPLSVILPRLYLGAERDVTQDRLASLGISYVLSVSRCSPQPSFLPCSRYLRIPIDDSLWDDLLPWIPQALHFIDSAMSSGGSVLVHCAAGISRSPALAVAYIMYSLGMDLDQAYRFVKERRPSISPNFNFLGQLQHFQGTLSHRTSAGDLLTQQLNNRLTTAAKANCAHVGQNMNHQVERGTSDAGEIRQEHRESVCPTDKPRQRHPPSEGHQQLSPSGKLWAQSQQQAQTPSEAQARRRCEPIKAAVTPPRSELPAGSASLLEKRKSLSLSLTPLGVSPPSPGCSGNDREAAERPQTRPRPGGAHREQSPPHGEQRPPHSECSRAEGLLSPFSVTLNKLLDWGERVLLGGIFVHPVRMGQPALPYRC